MGGMFQDLFVSPEAYDQKQLTLQIGHLSRSSALSGIGAGLLVAAPASRCGLRPALSGGCRAALGGRRPTGVGTRAGRRRDGCERRAVPSRRPHLGCRGRRADPGDRSPGPAQTLRPPRRAARRGPYRGARRLSHSLRTLTRRQDHAAARPCRPGVPPAAARSRWPAPTCGKIPPRYGALSASSATTRCCTGI